MLKTTRNFRDVGWLDLFEWSSHQRTTEDRVNTLGKIKLILDIIDKLLILNLVVELLTQVYTDLVLIIFTYKQIISIVLDKLW